MRYLNLITLMLLGVLLSCKKDKLEGERAILEGKWEWVYSVKTTSFHSPSASAQVDTIYAEHSSSSYALEFSRKGKMYLFQDMEISKEYRMVFSSFVLDGGSCLGGNFNANRYYYAIYPDNAEDNRFDGCVSSDSLTCFSKSFPFSYSENNYSFTFYENFFKKVN